MSPWTSRSFPGKHGREPYEYLRRKRGRVLQAFSRQILWKLREIAIKTLPWTSRPPPVENMSVKPRRKRHHVLQAFCRQIPWKVREIALKIVIKTLPWTSRSPPVENMSVKPRRKRHHVLQAFCRQIPWKLREITIKIAIKALFCTEISWQTTCSMQIRSILNPLFSC